MRLRLLILVLFVFLTGCVGPKQEKFNICPGKTSLKDSIAALEAAGKVLPFRASGQCFATVYENDKRRKEQFSIKVWFNPPAELRLFGDIAFNARGLDIGSNSKDFWIAAKPRELGNSFAWGLWQQQQEFVADLGPKIILEAFGSITFDKDADWSLSNEGPFDILTLKTQDRIVKKIYIYSCDYRVRKIEYFDDKGSLSLVLELSNYSIRFDGCSFASQMLIRLLHTDSKEDSFRIIFKTVSAFEYTAEKKQAFFQKPENMDGFEHVYQIVNGRLSEQK
jgi:hypothetical protein